MDHTMSWVVLFSLLYGCYTCLEHSLAVKGSEGRQIERINFKPKAKVVLKPISTNKEMLYGSVIWFKPREEQGESNTGKDVIHLRTRSRTTYRRQNKSLDVTGEITDTVKNNDENVSKNKPRNDPEMSTTRSSKRIEQTKQGNGDKVLKEIKRKNPKRADTDIKVEHPGNPRNMRRNNDRQNRRRNKNRKHNTKVDIENTTQKSNSNSKDAKKDSQENISENESNAKQEQNVEEETQATMNDSSKKQNENIVEENDSAIESQEKEKEVKAITEDKLLETTTEIHNSEESKEYSSINPSKLEETQPLTNSEKQKVVENADLLGLLLAQSDPSLVKVLIDNSSPENLNVFLSHSNITLEELRDIIAY